VQYRYSTRTTENKQKIENGNNSNLACTLKKPLISMNAELAEILNGVELEKEKM